MNTMLMDLLPVICATLWLWIALFMFFFIKALRCCIKNEQYKFKAILSSLFLCIPFSAAPIGLLMTGRMQFLLRILVSRVITLYDFFIVVANIVWWIWPLLTVMYFFECLHGILISKDIKESVICLTVSLCVLCYLVWEVIGNINIIN